MQLIDYIDTYRCIKAEKVNNRVHQGDLGATMRPNSITEKVRMLINQPKILIQIKAYRREG